MSTDPVALTQALIRCPSVTPEEGEDLRSLIDREGAKHALQLLLGFVPVALLVVWMHRWSLGAKTAIYANARMLAQLLADP